MPSTLARSAIISMSWNMITKGEVFWCSRWISGTSRRASSGPARARRPRSWRSSPGCPRRCARRACRSAAPRPSCPDWTRRCRRWCAGPDSPGPSGRCRCRGCGRGTWSASACCRRAGSRARCRPGPRSPGSTCAMSIVGEVLRVSMVTLKPSASPACEQLLGLLDVQRVGLVVDRTEEALGQERLVHGRRALDDGVGDALVVDQILERLAHLGLGQILVLLVEAEIIDGALRHLLDHDLRIARAAPRSGRPRGCGRCRCRPSRAAASGSPARRCGG